MDTNYKPHSPRPTVAGDDPFPLSIRISRQLMEEFRAVAFANHRTVSQELRHLMERHVAGHGSDTNRTAA